MYYCLIDCLALLVLLITNHDVVLKKTARDEQAVQKNYRYFLYAMICYYIVDFLWAWWYERQELDWLFLDTEIYFLVMAAGVLLWSRYVVSYLGLNNGFSSFLKYAGIVLFIGVLAATPLNRYFPVMFWFDGNGVYYGGTARNIMFIYQIILLLLTSVYTLSFSSAGSEKERNRHVTIGWSGIIIMVFVAVQIFFPTYPLYAISYMLGGCLLRTFVIENEREEYHRNLELALEREREQFNELNKAWTLAYKDALTGVKSKLAYAEKIEQIDREIAKGIRQELALVVLDVNNLKRINDTLGHDVGDEYIKAACRLICDSFKKSPVYRVGGDEFVVFLEQEDYENREKLLAAFNAVVEENRQHGAVVVAAGIAEYVPEQDNSCKRIFDRADEAMYKRKHALKMFPIAYLREHHETFLAECRSFKAPLAEVFMNSTAEKPEADAEMMDAILEEIRLAAESMDIDRLESIFDEMEEYQIPQEQEELWQQLVKAARQYDYRKIVSILAK